MGKKQKMKKAAAVAAAAAAAKAAVEQQTAAAVEEANKNNNDDACCSSSSNNNNNDNENGDKKTDLRAMRANMQKLMNLAKNMKSMPSTSRKSQASSGSGSEHSESESSDDSDDAVTVVQQSVKPTDKKAAAAAAATSVDGPEYVPIQKFSRGEKKARRLLMKLDLEKVANVSRVTMRKAKNVLLCIDQPEVYKCPNTKTLICFGEVRVEDTSNAAAAQAAERYLNDANVRATPQSKDGDQLNEAKADNDDDDNDAGNIDASQLDEKDIELVQMQSECSRQKAIKALLKHKSDVVNAIMELTVG